MEAPSRRRPRPCRTRWNTQKEGAPRSGQDGRPGPRAPAAHGQTRCPSARSPAPQTASKLRARNRAGDRPTRKARRRRKTTSRSCLPLRACVCVYNCTGVGRAAVGRGRAGALDAKQCGAGGGEFEEAAWRGRARCVGRPCAASGRLPLAGTEFRASVACWVLSARGRLCSSQLWGRDRGAGCGPHGTVPPDLRQRWGERGHAEARGDQQQPPDQLSRPCSQAPPPGASAGA